MKFTQSLCVNVLSQLCRVYCNLFCFNVLQVHLITKNIYETLGGDYNNLHHVISTIICINNKLGFYVALTLFWALYNKYFKKESIHYFKMYSVDKVSDDKKDILISDTQQKLFSIPHSVFQTFTQQRTVP